MSAPVCTCRRPLLWLTGGVVKCIRCLQAARHRENVIREAIKYVEEKC